MKHKVWPRQPCCTGWSCPVQYKLGLSSFVGNLYIGRGVYRGGLNPSLETQKLIFKKGLPLLKNFCIRPAHVYKGICKFRNIILVLQESRVISNQKLVIFQTNFFAWWLSFNSVSIWFQQQQGLMIIFMNFVLTWLFQWIIVFLNNYSDLILSSSFYW